MSPSIENKFNSIIRCFLYILIFWLPYSPAVVEVCVAAALILWFVKRSLSFFQAVRQTGHPAGKWPVFLKAFRPKPTFLDGPILCFLAAALLSLWGSFYIEQSFHGFLTKTLEWFIVYFLVVEVMDQQRHVEITLRIFLLTALFVGVDAVLQFYFLKKDIFLGRELTRGGATAAFKHANLLGGFTAVAGLLALTVMGKEGKGASRLSWLSLGTAITCLWGLVLSFSRGAWLGFLVGLMVSIYLTNRKILVWGLALLFMAGVLLFTIPSAKTRETLRITKNSLHDTMSWRLGLWQDSLKMIADKPVFGHGINTYMKLFQEYRRKYQGYADYSPTYAHNGYVQLATETGLLGLAAFLWIFCRLFKNVIAKAKELRQNTSSHKLLVSLSAALMVWLVHSGVDTNLYSLQLSILFWFLVGLLVAEYKIISSTYGDLK